MEHQHVLLDITAIEFGHNEQGTIASTYSNMNSFNDKQNK
jgi:hypothetical protein